MKAIICDHWGMPDELKLGDLPSPALRPGAVRIAIKACSINYADTLMVQGLYQEKPPFPFSPGMEAAGIIAEVGEGIDYLYVGDRVMALCGHGGLAEEAVVDASTVIPIPDSMPFNEAAAFAVAYGTSHIALAHRGQLRSGESLLVHGAAGGVGLTAVELGKLLGATVIATASTPEKLALAGSYGADHLINYTDENFVDRVKEITNRKGADVIFDPVGGDVFDQSLRCIAWEGRLLIIGFASGRIPDLPANRALLKNCSAVGVFWGAYSVRKPAVLLRSLNQLLGWYQEGKLKPHVTDTYPLEDTAAAMNQLLSRQAKGKVVVEVG